MIKEAKNIDFYTTGKEPTNEEFALISAWIKEKKTVLKARREKLLISKEPNARSKKLTSKLVVAK